MKNFAKGLMTASALLALTSCGGGSAGGGGTSEEANMIASLNRIEAQLAKQGITVEIDREGRIKQSAQLKAIKNPSRRELEELYSGYPVNYYQEYVRLGKTYSYSNKDLIKLIKDTKSQIDSYIQIEKKLDELITKRVSRGCMNGNITEDRDLTDNELECALKNYSKIYDANMIGQLSIVGEIASLLKWDAMSSLEYTEEEIKWNCEQLEDEVAYARFFDDLSEAVDLEDRLNSDKAQHCEDLEKMKRKVSLVKIPLQMKAARAAIEKVTNGQIDSSDEATDNNTEESNKTQENQNEENE